MSSVPLLCLLLTICCVISSKGFFIRSPKIGEIRQKNLLSMVECFERHSKQNKRLFAQTQGNVATLFDENGQEIICTGEKKDVAYDQHCFFSPLNCFFTKLRLNKQPKL